MADDDTTQTDLPEDQNPAPEQDDWTPPSKEEDNKVKKALAKANAEAKKWREQAQALQRQSEDDAGKAVREAQEAAERKLKPIAVKAAAKAAFLEAGAKPERVARLMALLKLDEITVDDDGEVTGVDEQVAELKADVPELFGTLDKQPRTPRVSASDRPPANGRPQTTGDKIAAMLGV